MKKSTKLPKTAIATMEAYLGVDPKAEHGEDFYDLLLAWECASGFSCVVLYQGTPRFLRLSKVGRQWAVGNDKDQVEVDSTLMKRIKNGAFLTYHEIDVIGAGLDICRKELDKKKPDTGKIKEGLDSVLQCLAALMPE